MNCPDINEENSAYQIDEPNWLFEYLEQAFRVNYHFIASSILEILKADSETK